LNRGGVAALLPALASTPPIPHQRDVSHYAEFVARLHTLYEHGYTDAQMAVQLTQEGFHTARTQAVSARTVLAIRRQHGWVSHYQRHRRAGGAAGASQRPSAARPPVGG